MKTFLSIARSGLLTLVGALSVCATSSAQGPVGNWPFSGNANDISGRAHHGTISGAQIIPDRFGNANSAFAFNGSSDLIRVPGHSDFRFGNGQEFTISVWVKACTTQPRLNRNLSNGPGIVGTQGSSQGWAIVTAGVTPFTDKVDFPAFNDHCTDGTFDWLYPQGPNPWPTTRDGLWHHIAVVASRWQQAGDPLRWHMVRDLYWDSRVVGTYTDGFNFSCPKDHSANTTDLIIGMSQATGLYFNGAIDDVRIYQRALSSTEVSALYSENGWPSSGSSSSLTVLPATSPVICEGDSVRLEAIGTGAIGSYRWTPATGLSDPRSPRPMARPTQTTTYTVEASTGAPCPQLLQTRTITVEVRPSPKIERATTVYACRDDRRTIGSNVSDGLPPYRFSWSPATDLSSASEQFPTLTATTSRVYEVTVTDARGCSMVGRLTLTVLPRPRAIAGPDTLFCAGGSGVTLGGEPIGGTPPYRYRWSPRAGLDDSTLMQPVARPDTTTRYVVEVSDAAGCRGFDTVEVRASAAAHADAGADVAICAGGGVAIGSPSLPGYRYSWSPATGLSSTTSSSPMASPAVTTTYVVLARNAAGCEALDSVLVSVHDPAVAVDRAALSFGMLDGCTSSKELTLEIANTGTSGARMTAATFTTSEFVLVSPAPPFDLAPGERRTLRLRYAPQGAGTSRDTLRLRGEPCELLMAVAVDGAREASLLALDVSRVELGRRLSCELPDTTVVVTVTNTTTSAATLAQPIVAAPYTITSPTFPATVAPGGSLEVRLRYAPPGAGDYAGELLLPFALGSCRDTLRATLGGSVEQPLMATLDAVDFGALTGCTTVRDTAIALINDGSFDLLLSAATAPAGFVVLDAMPMRIAARSSAMLRLRFAPTAPGSVGGSLLLRYGPCDRTREIALDGTMQAATFTLAGTLDFGRVVDCGAPVRRQMDLGFSDGGSGLATVARVTVSGPFTTSLAAGQTIASGATHAFTVDLAPGVPGVVTGTIEVTLEPCGVVRRVALGGERAAAMLAAGPLDFGSRAAGASTTADLIVVNAGDTAIVVEGVDDLAAPFAIGATTPGLPATLAPGDTLRVAITYTATLGPSVDTARLTMSAPCATTTLAQVLGTGEQSARATVTLPRIAAAAGDRLRLPIMLESHEGLDAASAHAFEAEITFDRTLLVAIDRVGATTDGSLRRVVVRGRRTGGDTLATIDALATLGMATSTPLRIERFAWLDASSPVAMTLGDGELRIEGICEAGGTRLFDGSGEVALWSIAPNPSGGMTAIEYELAEPGHTELYVVDAAGRRVATLLRRHAESGRYIHWLQAGELPSGSYRVVLATPTIVLSEQLEVRR